MLTILELQAVDYVIIFDQDTPLELIERIQPDVLVKGGDWAVEDIVGNEIVWARGGKVLSIPFNFQRSTTAVIDKIRNSRLSPDIAQRR